MKLNKILKKILLTAQNTLEAAQKLAKAHKPERKMETKPLKPLQQPF